MLKLKIKYDHSKMFEDFIKKWSEPYNQIKHAIKLINLFPKELKTLNLGNLIQFEQVDEYQREWVWLYDQFDNDIEKSYFKPCFVPINVDDYRLFIDLSSSNFPIIEPIFDSINHNWFHFTRFEKTVDLMIHLDSKNQIPPVIDRDFAQSIDKIIDEYLIKNPEILLKIIDLKKKYRNS